MPKPKKFVPAHKQVAAYLREQITSGKLSEGDKLPAMTELADMFGIRPGTAHRGIQILESEGLVRPEYRRGTYVRPSSMWKINQP